MSVNEGSAAFTTLVTGRNLMQFNARTIRAEDAIKLFKPAVVEFNTQMVTPLPGWYVDWVKGFEEAQRSYCETTIG